jgi:Flp pilus assembly protein TadG
MHKKFPPSSSVPCRRLDLQGQALVEFALILPILLLLAVGIMDFGRALFVFSEVSNATREAARYGANTDVIDKETLLLDCDSIRTRGKSMFTLAPTTLVVSVTIERPSGSNFIFKECSAPVQAGDRVRVEARATVELLTLELIGPLFGSNTTLKLPITFVASRSLLPATGVSTGPTSTPLPFSDNPLGTQVAQTAIARAAKTAVAATATSVAATATSDAATATSVAATATSDAAMLAALEAADQTATIAAQQTATAVAHQTATAIVATAVARQTIEAAEATAISVAATTTAAALPPHPPTNFTAACGPYNTGGRFVTFTWLSGGGTTNSFKIYDGDTVFLDNAVSPATSLTTIPFSATKTFSIKAFNAAKTTSTEVFASSITCGRPISIAWADGYPTNDKTKSVWSAYFKVTVTDTLSGTAILNATVTVSGTKGTVLPLTTMTPGSGRYCYQWVNTSNDDLYTVVTVSYNNAIASTGVVTVTTAGATDPTCP